MNLFFQKKKKIVSSNEKKQPIHMRYHFFVHHEWFLQNLEKEAVRTNMHTTVYAKLMTGSFFYLLYTVNYIENTIKVRLCATHSKQIGSTGRANMAALRSIGCNLNGTKPYSHCKTICSAVS